MSQPFHYSFKIRDLARCRTFYTQVLECREGRSTDTWIDFDFFGHQLSVHRSDHFPELDFCGEVDGIRVPIPHFGCVLDASAFDALQARLEEAKVEFLVRPRIRHEGIPGEQRTMFILDPDGNPLEFKTFSRPDEVFAT